MLVSSNSVNRYLRWQDCWHVWNWLSHALRHGVLKVAGQTRLHDAFWLEQFAAQASLVASVMRNQFLFAGPSATAIPHSANTSATPTASLIETSYVFQAKSLA
jgi:hypothetical protein